MMRALGGSRCLPVLLVLVMLRASVPTAVFAQQHPASPADTAATHLATPLDEARELVKSGDFDRAIEILKPVIERSRRRVAEQRAAYLLLIKSHVYPAND